MKVKSGLIERGDAILIYGDGGVGKTTLASKFPSPIFFDLDRTGTAKLNVNRAVNDDGELITEWSEFLAALDWLIANAKAHGFKTVVLDTVDALERVIHEFLCVKKGVETIGDYGGGFGKGFDAAMDEIRKMFEKFSELQKIGIHIVLVGHKKLAPAKNPDGKDWERVEPKCNGKIAGFLMETLDAVLYVGHNVLLDTSKEAKRVKAMDAVKVMFTSMSPTYFAKNRMMLPSEMRMEYNDLVFHMRLDAVGLGERIALKVSEMDAKKLLTADEKTRLGASVENNKNDAEKLKDILQYLIKKAGD